MGFRRIGLSGGGGINGAFLRAGLIDEISVVVAPLAIGGRQTPTLFDAPDLPSLAGAARLALRRAQPIGEGAVWLHYDITHAAAPTAGNR
jgi:riboflavin biosynthesis pyrimidine reductase